MTLVVGVPNGRLFLLQAMCLFEQIESHDLHHVNHAVIAPDLLLLVQIVQNRVLSLIDVKHLRIGREQCSHKIFGRNHTPLKVSFLQWHFVPREAEHVKGLKGRNFCETVVE